MYLFLDIRVRPLQAYRRAPAEVAVTTGWYNRIVPTEAPTPLNAAIVGKRVKKNKHGDNSRKKRDSKVFESKGKQESKEGIFVVHSSASFELFKAGNGENLKSEKRGMTNGMNKRQRRRYLGLVSRVSKSLSKAKPQLHRSRATEGEVLKIGYDVKGSDNQRTGKCVRFHMS